MEPGRKKRFRAILGSSVWLRQGVRDGERGDKAPVRFDFIRFLSTPWRKVAVTAL